MRPSSRPAIPIVIAAVIAVGLVTEPKSEADDSASSPTQPNIVFVLIDDLGQEGLGSYGSTYSTPNLDQLAASGMRFTHAYATPLCSPTRVKVLTGRRLDRAYTEWGLLEPTEITFGNLLRDAGYATFAAGKWQLWGFPLGWPPGPECCYGRGQTPEDAGFDSSLVWHFYNKGSRFWHPLFYRDGADGAKPADGKYGPDLLTDFLIEKIESQVKERPEQPFFAYYPMVLVHFPYEPTPDSAAERGRPAPPADVKKGPSPESGDPANFPDMVAYADKSIGRILAKLDELGVRDNTLMLVTGDNGTPRGIDTKMKDGRTIPGGKGLSIDTGIHVPMLASWPGVIEGGQVSRALVDVGDILPTLAEAAGAALPQDRVIDGKSLLPVARGEVSSVRDWLFTHYHPRFSTVEGKAWAYNHRFKLYEDGRFFEWAEDPQEEHPLQQAALSREAKAAKTLLQGALDQSYDR